MGTTTNLCSCDKDQSDKEKENEISAHFSKKVPMKKNAIITQFLNEEFSNAEAQFLKTELGLGVENVRYILVL